MNKLGKIFAKGILQTIIIIVAGVVIGLSVNALRQDKVEPADGITIKTGQSSAQANPNVIPITKISVWEGFKAFRSGKALFIDARSEYDYNLGHIPKAINIHPGKGDKSVKENEKDKSRLIITYCLGIDCPLAEELAKELAADGFTNVKEMPEGWEAWSMSGYPQESGR
jgi:rhodanese-related sulfurtransferase